MNRYRILVFEDADDCMLICADGDGPVLLPRSVDAPFTRESVGAALKKCGDKARVIATRSGRWTRASIQARNAIKAERCAQQDEQVAAEAIMTASSRYPDIQKRSEAIIRKQAVDAELRDLKARHGAAKQAAATRGVFMPADGFRRLEERIATLKTESLALQVRLGQLREIEAERKRRQHRTTAECFVSVAARRLDEATFASILQESEDMLDEDD